jgi:fused signal recognition particle receptor
MIDTTSLLVAGACAGLILVLLLARELRRGRRASAHAPLTVGHGGAGLAEKLAGLFGRGSSLDDGFWSELETTLLEADVGLDVTERLLAAARDKRTPEEVKRTLREEMVAMFAKELPAAAAAAAPRVVLVLGVNGVGKTTTIAKLAHRAQREGKRPLLVACDTFRAAAIDQLIVWARRLECDVVAQAPGADAAAVAFDGIERASARGHDIVIIDTAGRLHTKQHLMEELKKIHRVIGRALPSAPHEKLIVIDATVGGNGLAQAREFHAAVGLTGVVVTKLDGTAKGGVLLAVAGELDLPVTHVGVGERMEDLKPFDARAFVQSILGS